MKANEAIEKIYLHVRANKELGTTWHGTRICVNDIEYTRTDAFIDKACKYLEPIIFSMNSGDRPDTDKFIEDFKNYMKGE